MEGQFHDPPFLYMGIQGTNWKGDWMKFRAAWIKWWRGELTQLLEAESLNRSKCVSEIHTDKVSSNVLYWDVTPCSLVYV
jgi:hypothetical protein